MKFPSGISGDRRYIIDQTGNPWFGRGDTAWSLVGQLGPRDVDLYLNDRAARGFNLVLANVLEHHYSDNAPHNYRDDPPFTGRAFRSAPNEAYWQHVDYIIEAARLRGITLLLCPAYLGNRTEEGWSDEIAAATTEEMAGYGTFLRDRYGEFPNIMWLIGHDRPPSESEKARMEALASALPQDDLVGLGANPSADALGTVAWDPTAISPDFETIYSYDGTPVIDASRAWAMHPTRPVIFLEGRYEQERTGEAGDPLLRRQEYGSFVAGVTAVIFGNNPIWHFESVSLYDYEGTWQDNLASLGSSDAQRLGDLVRSFPWWETEPDTVGELLVDGDPAANLAVRYSDSHALLYVPIPRTVVLDMARFTAVEQVELNRIDPRSGVSEHVGDYPTEQLVAVRPPGLNSAGDDDWVYVVSPST